MAGLDSLDLNINFRAQTLEAEKVLRRLANASGKALSESLNKALNDTKKRLDEIRDKKLKWDKTESRWTRTSDATWDPIKKAWILPDIDEGLTAAKIKEQEELFQKLSKAKLERARDQARRELRHGIVETIGAVGTANIFFKNLIKPAMDYEKSLTNVAKVYNLNKKATDEFSVKLMELTQRLPVPVQLLGDLSYQMAQLGIEQGKLPTAVELAVKAGMGLDIPLADVGQRIGTLKAAYGIKDLDPLERVLDFINEASNKVAATPAEILNALTRVAPLTSSIKLKAEQAAALVATLLGAGWEPEQVETGVKDFLAGLRTMFEAKSGESSRYRAVQQLGLDKFTFEEAYRKDPIKAIDLFFDALEHKRKSGADIDVLMLKIFGQHHFTKLLTYAGEAGREKRKQLMGIYEDKSYIGSLEKEYKRVSETASSLWVVMKNNLDALKITLGTTLLPSLKMIVEAFTKVTRAVTEFAKAHPDLVRFVATFGAIAGSLALMGTALRGIYTILNSLAILGVGAGKLGVFGAYVAGVLALTDALGELEHKLAASAGIMGFIAGAIGAAKNPKTWAGSPLKIAGNLAWGGLKGAGIGTGIGFGAEGAGWVIEKIIPSEKKDHGYEAQTRVDKKEKDVYNNTQTYHDNRLFNINITTTEEFKSFLDIPLNDRPKGFE